MLASVEFPPHAPACMNQVSLIGNFVSIAFRLQLGVADGLADHLLHCALDLLRRSDNPILVHSCILRLSSLNGKDLSCSVNRWSLLIWINSIRPMTFWREMTVGRTNHETGTPGKSLTPVSSDRKSTRLN